MDFLSTDFLTHVLLFHDRLFNLTVFQNIRSIVSFVRFNLDFNKLNKLSVGIKLHGNFTPRAEVVVDELKLAFTRTLKARLKVGQLVDERPDPVEEFREFQPQDVLGVEDVDQLFDLCVCCQRLHLHSFRVDTLDVELVFRAVHDLGQLLDKVVEVRKWRMKSRPQ